MNRPWFWFWVPVMTRSRSGTCVAEVPQNPECLSSISYRWRAISITPLSIQ